MKKRVVKDWVTGQCGYCTGPPHPRHAQYVFQVQLLVQPSGWPGCLCVDPWGWGRLLAVSASMTLMDYLPQSALSASRFLTYTVGSLGFQLSIPVSVEGFFDCVLWLSPVLQVKCSKNTLLN